MDVAMLNKMNRFWRRSEVAAAYRIPPGQEGVIDAVPTAHSDEATGEEYVLEHDVDRAIAAAFPSARPDGPHPRTRSAWAGRITSGCRDNGGG